MFRVYKQACKECLFSKNRIVSPKKASLLLREIRIKDTHFVCHKATMRGEEICCRKFYDTQDTTPLQLAKRFEAMGHRVIDWVDQPDPEEDPCATYDLKLDDSGAPSV